MKTTYIYIYILHIAPSSPKWLGIKPGRSRLTSCSTLTARHLRTISGLNNQLKEFRAPNIKFVHGWPCFVDTNAGSRYVCYRLKSNWVARIINQLHWGHAKRLKWQQFSPCIHCIRSNTVEKGDVVALPTRQLHVSH